MADKIVSSSFGIFIPNTFLWRPFDSCILNRPGTLAATTEINSKHEQRFFLFFKKAVCVYAPILHTWHAHWVTTVSEYLLLCIDEFENILSSRATQITSGGLLLLQPKWFSLGQSMCK